MNRISSLLVVAALIAGMVGCVSSPAQYTQYDLTIFSTEGGEITAIGEGTFTCDEGEVVNLAATPVNGYRFVNWTGDVDTIANINAASTTIAMNGDYSITANFEVIPPVQYSLTISGSAGGSVTTPGQGTFPYDLGTTVSLVAAPATGYRFVNWTGDVDTIANINAASTTIAMNGDYSITANFEVIPPVQYSLTISGSAGGSVTTPGQGTFSYDAGAVVSLVAAPATGYRFVNWTGNVGTIANVNAASTTVTINGDGSITANFEPIPRVRYNLTITSSSGGWVTSPGMGTFSYDAGAVVSLVANPTCIYQYQFVNWTGDVGTIANTNAASTTITMNGDYSITANFSNILMSYYTLTVAVSGSGLTSPAAGQHTYTAGTVVPIIAMPASGYQFVNWTGNVGTVANTNAASTIIAMNGDYSITANFSNIPVTYYTLTVAVSGSGLTSPAVGQHTHAAGTVVPIIATPASGYRFVDWTGNVGTIASANAASTTITMNEDYSITANFEQIPTGQFDLTTSSTTGGSVTVPGEGTFTYDSGTVISLAATPDAGYHFVNWTGDVGTIANVNAASTTITMSGSYSITATFLEDSPSPPGIGYTEAQAEQLIIVLVNGQRQLSGLPALSEDPLLAGLAKEHSISMVVNHFFSHDRYPGERSFDYGMLPGTIRGENIAMIPTRQFIPGPYLSLQEVCAWAVSLWMSSPGHRANILRSSFTRTGVGVAFSEGGDYLYITQMFEGNY
jgi:uncharacterized protein YkwD/ribosomal protein L21E